MNCLLERFLATAFPADIDVSYFRPWLLLFFCALSVSFQIVGAVAIMTITTQTNSNFKILWMGVKSVCSEIVGCC